MALDGIKTYIVLPITEDISMSPALFIVGHLNLWHGIELLSSPKISVFECHSH